VLPKVTKSRTDNELPQRAAPNADILLPNREKLLKLIEDPNRTKSKTLKLDPNLTIPYADRELPSRVKLRSEMELPINT
jgi:hypothetical protein